MTPTKEQLIDALSREYEYLCHDDFDPNVDPSPEDYRQSLHNLTIEELIEETSTDDDFTLEQFLEIYS